MNEWIPGEIIVVHEGQEVNFERMLTRQIQGRYVRGNRPSERFDRVCEQFRECNFATKKATACAKYEIEYEGAPRWLLSSHYSH